MPTASEYDAVADRLDDVARYAGGPLTALGYANQGVSFGGSITDLVTRTLLEAADHMAVSARACRAAADEARVRSAACAVYTTLMREYRAAMARANEWLAAAPWSVSSIPWPVRPVRPGPWAEEG